MPFQFHLPLQLVGGVGRSFVAWLLAQWALLVAPTKPPMLFDADPWGGWAFKGKVSKKPFGDLAFGGHVDQRLLDDVVERMRAAGGTAILDPGGAVARDVAEYFVEPVHANAIIEHGQMIVHFIVLGGARQRATTCAALQLAQLLPTAARAVLWRNEFFDRIDRAGLEQELAGFPRPIETAVDLPHCSTDLARDLHDLVSLELTIADAVAAGRVLTMASRRLLAFCDDMVARLACLAQPVAPHDPGTGCR